MKSTTMSDDPTIYSLPRRGHFARSLLAISTGLLCCTALTTPALAQDADEPADEIVVTGALDALPLKDVGSVFGFDKTLAETPRSASSISSEQIERFGITDIYDLVAQAPGTFTNSFFGVGGALDIRGTPGEVYFRGVRRLDNPGNYPTPIAASERIDIVRGPASPIYGPSKTGGYMNFVPKSARVAGGSLLSGPEGDIQLTGGSWGRKDVQATIRGPLQLGAQSIGYSLFGEYENSGSYYDNMHTKNLVLQASFDADLSDNLRTEFGGQFQHYRGQQNGGWNRLTQDLVDNGTYITGSAKPLDGIDGSPPDGQLSQAEFNKIIPGGFSVFGGFQCGGNVFAASETNACFTSAPYDALNLVNTGTTKLSRRKVLTGKDDRLNNNGTALYWDLIFTGAEGLEIKNQLFYDSYENINENSYGFSQFHDSWVVEDKIVASYTDVSDLGKFSVQMSPSVRYTHFKHGDDFDYEYFHRVDLSVGYNATSDRLLSTESDSNYTTYLKGHYTDYAFAGLVDMDFAFGLDLLLGGRYDNVQANSSSILEKLRAPAGIVQHAKGNDSGFSWTASASYKTPWGLIPYFTVARQTTVIDGQGAEIDAGSVAGNAFLAASKLTEGGVKGSFLNDTLYAAVSMYKQTRTDHNVQSITVNQAVETKGLEAEFRWSVDKHLLVTGAYTRTKVYNLTALDAGTLFSFFGIEDLVNVTDPTLFLGGQPIGLVPIGSKSDARRAGIPTNLYSATATYAFDNGLAFSASGVHVDSVFSGQSQAVRLPSYTTFDLGVSFETGPWLFRVVSKNITNERYFRANFTELFGSTIVLPEKPRSVQGSVVYKF